MTLRLFAGLLILAAATPAQRRVDPRNAYQRIICIVPLVGNGTADDPKRPQYAPWPVSQDPKGIIAYYFLPSDEGKTAIVEFVARDRAAFQPLLNDANVRVFEKGRTPRKDLAPALKQFRKDLDFDKFGMVMP
jgi:hypothetical protein